jgi:excisionase family DNA binding protein
MKEQPFNIETQHWLARHLRDRLLVDGVTQNVGRVDVMERQMVTIMEAAKIAGVSRRCIYNWIATGKVKCRRTAGGMTRIFEDSLWQDPKLATRRSVSQNLRVLPTPTEN